ncbi:MAG: lipid IV(A) 3-deoxy-D-manno-octulosonic acid transferase [Nitrosomonadales bacterium]|nr:lipid IV(A) 3-deoxy-D-manno-octulosonic acid transferase [Nitrosomonadales bacterium]
MLNPRTFYSSALWLLLPYIFVRLAWRARKQPEYLHHIAERFGFYTRRPDFDNEVQPVIWLHAVSVGETRATQSLVTRLRATYPDHRILLTHTTPTGRAASEQLYGDEVMRVYLPYDYPFAVRRFLRHFKPQLGILMETEIWVNLIHACHEAGTPLLLLNGRMSEKSAKGYAGFAKLTRIALGELTAIAAQTTDDAARLTALGAHNVSVMGNLKFDISPPSAMLELGKQLREQFGAGRRVFLAASTRDGEEALLLDALKQMHDPKFLVVMVPRHPQRFNEVASLLEQRGIRYQRRSELNQSTVRVEPVEAHEPVHISTGSMRTEGRGVSAETQVVLGDSMGEMFAYYAAANLAFIGGSLLPLGGQNLIESCAVGTPVLIGPYTYNFAEATRLAIQNGAAIQVHDATILVSEALHLLNDASALNVMRGQCLKFVGSNRGATDKSVQIIGGVIDKSPSPRNILAPNIWNSHES